MCGLVGILKFTAGEMVDWSNIQRMCRVIAHRGPDDEGIYIDKNNGLGLGHRRLSIIDLEAGKQPMSNVKEDVWVVFNGEIYNFPSLRIELESLGHTFRTQSDTEVIIHGYEQWGLDVLTHLNGMFAIALWDRKRKRLLLARDRAGIKPLYYRMTTTKLEFASEIRALTTNGNSKQAINVTALNLFLRYRYTPSPLTMFKVISKLAPGTRLVFEGGRPRVELWWKFKPRPFNPAPSFADAQEGLLERYRDAVKSQLISDVPVGLLLSGGIDSALLLAFMNQSGNSFQTFTVGFGSSFSDDELSEASCSAKRMNSPNTSVLISKEMFETALPKIIETLEEPVASPSVVPMYFLCERARADVKVVLMGQGPDELMGGYKRHLGTYYGGYFRNLPPPLSTGIRSLGKCFFRKDSVRRAINSLFGSDRIERYQNILSIMSGAIIDGLFQDSVLPSSVDGAMLDCWEELLPLMVDTDELGGLQFLEVRSWLPDALLLYADKLSMAHGLEVRVPYLDQNIIEYVEQLPSCFKIRNGGTKWLHQKISRQLLSREITRRKKKAFAANVVDRWFLDSRNSIIQSTLMDHDSLIYDYLKPQAVHLLIQQHQSGFRDNHKIIFSLAVLEEWLRSAAV